MNVHVTTIMNITYTLPYSPLTNTHSANTLESHTRVQAESGEIAWGTIDDCGLVSYDERIRDTIECTAYIGSMDRVSSNIHTQHFAPQSRVDGLY